MKYYKVLTKDLRAPNNTDYSYEDWESKTFRVKGRLSVYRNGLHLYKSLANISVGNFGERVFEAEPIGKFLDDKDKICCRGIRILCEIKPEEVEDSKWAYLYCRNIRDRVEVRAKIVESEWAYRYCQNIRDRAEMRAKINKEQSE